MKLCIDNQDFIVKTLAELEDYLQAYHHHSFAEIWLEYTEEKSISLLKNENRAWLCYFEQNYLQSFHSENPEYQDKTATLAFTLANGQVDEYPIAYCYPTAIAYKALHYFFKHQEKADFIHWIED